jgi:hypothetical protein
MAMNVEAVLIIDKLESMATTVTLQPRSFACPHCGKPIEVDSVLNALSSSDLARAMRDRRKRELTPEAASAMGKKSAAKRRGNRRQQSEEER